MAVNHPKGTKNESNSQRHGVDIIQKRRCKSP